MDIRYTDEAKIFKSTTKTVYVLHGEYEFLQKELAKKILAFLMTEEEMETGLVHLDGNDDGAIDSLIDAALSPSLFAPKQVIFVNNAEKFQLKKAAGTEGKKLSEEQKYTNHEQYSQLLRIIKETKSGVHIVMICGEDLKKPAGKTGKSRSEKMLQRCYEDLDKHGALVHFPRMYDEDFTAWIQDRARRYGLRLSYEEAAELLDLAGSDVRHLANEIEKLSTYVGNGNRLEEGVFYKLVTSSEDIFVNQLVNYIMDGRAKAALRALKKSIEGGDNPVFIATVIGSRLRMLWQARYLLDKGYFPNLPDEYKFGGKAVVPAGMARVTDADRSVLTAEKSSSILSKTAFAVFHVLKPARRYTIEKIELALTALADVEKRLKGIERPKHGNDEIMIQNYIVDVAKMVKSGAAPKKRVSR